MTQIFGLILIAAAIAAGSAYPLPAVASLIIGIALFAFPTARTRRGGSAGAGRAGSYYNSVTRTPFNRK